MKKLVCAVVAVGASLSVAACGSATVDNNAVDPSATVAPLERGVAATSDASAPASSSVRRSAQRPASSTSAEPQPEDRSAQEVEQAPMPQVSGNDADFLSRLRAGGIAADGIEDQLIGAGQAACNPDDGVTVGAVAGQLLEQGRTNLSVEEVTALIDAQAHSTIC